MVGCIFAPFPGLYVKIVPIGKGPAGKKVPLYERNIICLSLNSSVPKFVLLSEEVSYEDKQKIAEFIKRICRKENIDPQDLWMASRIRPICQIVAQTVYKLVENFGISLAEVALQVGVFAFAISEALTGK